jgi:hypothetical protein
MDNSQFLSIEFANTGASIERGLDKNNLPPATNMGDDVRVVITGSLTSVHAQMVTQN